MITESFAQRAISPLDPLSWRKGSNAWSRSNLAIVYESTVDDTAEPSTFIPPLIAQESAQVLVCLHHINHGTCAIADNSLQDGLLHNENVVYIDLEQKLDPVDGHSLPFTHSNLQRATTVQTISSTWTVSYIFGRTMQLDKLMALIQSHSSLQRSEILSTKGYKQKRKDILHRSLVLEIRRGEKSPVWI